MPPSAQLPQATQPQRDPGAPGDLELCNPPAPPVYVEGKVPGEIAAMFPSGAMAAVARGRVRSYPGLISEAPATLSLYEDASLYIGPGQRVFDIGCGAGTGTWHLAMRHAQVIAIDVSEPAVLYTKSYVPEAQCLVSDLGACPMVAKGDAAVVIDVLTQVDDPRTVLRSIRALLPRGGKLWVSEATATPAQYLRRPLRRAFSRRAIECLIRSAGFDVTSCDESAPFISIQAVACDDRGCDKLLSATRRVRQGEFKLALGDFELAQVGAEPGVVLESMIGIGECLWRLGRGDDAMRAYFQVQEREPNEPRAAAAIARACVAMGDIDGGLEIARGASRFDPCEVEVAAVRATIAERILPRSALAQWMVVANLAPDQFEYALKAAEVASAQGDHETGIFVLERVRCFGDLYGGNLLVAIATALYNAGREEDALLEAREAKLLFPNNTMVTDLCQQLGDA